MDLRYTGADGSMGLERTTVILGAGAVLDFDFSEITFPSTSNMTEKIIDIKVQGLDVEKSDLISVVS